MPTRRSFLRTSASLAVVPLVAPTSSRTALASEEPGLAYANPTFPLADEDFETREKVDVTGKVAVVAGASTGIGRAVAENLVQRGFVVVGTSRTPGAYTPPPGFSLWELDLTVPRSVAAFGEQVKATFGRVDLLVLNAGRFFIGKYAESDMRRVQETFDTNLHGHQMLYRSLHTALPSTGYARVFMTASVIDVAYLFEPPTVPGLPVPLPPLMGDYYYPYAASKAGLARAGHCLHGRLSNTGSNVRISVFYPNIVATDIAKDMIIGSDPRDPETAYQIELFRTFVARGSSPVMLGKAYGQMSELAETFLTAYVVNPAAIPGSIEDIIQCSWPSEVCQEEDRTVRTLRC